MGLILAKLIRNWWYGKEYKIIFVGLNNAGKTTILYRLTTGEVVGTKPTIGSNVEELKYHNLRLTVWDIGGQDSLRKSWSSYYAQTDCVVFVLDSTDCSRLDVIQEQLKDILHHQDIGSAPLLFLANKQDLPTALSAGDLSTQLQLTNIKDRKWQIHGCSALKGDGLETALDWIVNNIT
ncbi:unnamed protein product [Auanema sp. JU1783]|nr:unnamed protein product [Auanema sp. JU1783]